MHILDKVHCHDVLYVSIQTHLCCEKCTSAYIASNERIYNDIFVDKCSGNVENLIMFIDSNISGNIHIISMFIIKLIIF